MPKTAEELKAEELEAERLKLEAEQEKEDPEQEPEELTAEELKTRLADAEKKLKAANRESADRRKKIETFEAEETKRKEAELTESQRIEARAKTAEEEKDRLAKENRELKLRGQFEKKIGSMKLSFANDKASDDAFAALDLEEVGEDLSGLEQAIKTLLSDRPYFFTKQSETQSLNDGSSKGKAKAGASTREAVERKRSGVTPL